MASRTSDTSPTAVSSAIEALDERAGYIDRMQLILLSTNPATCLPTGRPPSRTAVRQEERG